MSHAVHFRSGDGSTTFEQHGSLDEALARVEQLRNEQGVSEVRVYREVPVTFRTYYKATVANEGASTPDEQPFADAPVAAAPPAPERSAAPPADPPPGAMPLSPPPAPPAASSNGRDDDEPAPEETGQPSGRGSLFSRG